MSNAVSFKIDLAPTDSEMPKSFTVRVVTSEGDPVSGAMVAIRFEGQGTLHPHNVETKTILSTDADGLSMFEWWPYPRYNPRRPLKCAVSVVATKGHEHLQLTLGSTFQIIDLFADPS